MNKFKVMIDDMARRASEDKTTKDLLVEIEIVKEGIARDPNKPEERAFRLPYSSDPPSIEEQWK